MFIIFYSNDLYVCMYVLGMGKIGKQGVVYTCSVMHLSVLQTLCVVYAGTDPRVHQSIVFKGLTVAQTENKNRW